MSILVTGGAGYIGSHTVIELIQNGYDVVIVDNLVNSSYDSIARIEYIVGKAVPFFNVDLRDHDKLTNVFKEYDIQSVIHFAALKAVGESTKIPLDYYDNNVNGTINLLRVMQEQSVKTIVFSSSATVYGDATRFENMIPIPEHCPNDPTNPYGKTKYIIEQIIHDLFKSDPEWKAAILRYFNPIGAHPSGLIGEDPLGIPNNLLPYLAQVAIGRREKLSIFGNDYDSHDGTPIRDYIHVIDLAQGHISALDYLNNEGKGLFREWNLGTGKGSTVFDVYHAFCKAVGRELPYEVVGRRDGDVLNLTANPTRANSELKWFAKLSIETACKDLWKWTTENPFGFHVDNYQWSEFGKNNRLHQVKIDGFDVSVMNHGATIQSVKLDNDDLVLGFDQLDEYKDVSNPYFGATIGRFANRIKDSKLSLDGTVLKLDSNENGNTLHGGRNGFDKRQWLGPIAKQHNQGVSLSFKLIDDDGSQGFPGELETVVKYTIEKGSIGVEYESKLVKGDATVVNLTNHSYFKLGGTVDSYEVELCTDQYLKTDNGIPIGGLTKLPSKKFTIGNQEIDNNFIVRSNESLDTRQSELVKIATIKSTHSVNIYTTEPSFQLYTGDYIDTKSFGKRSGLALEPARPNNSITDDSKQVILRKDDVYGSFIKYEFN